MLELNNLDKMFFDDALKMIIQKRYLPAISLIKKAIDINAVPDYYLELAELYYEMGDISECKSIYIKLFTMTNNMMYSVLSLKELSQSIQDKAVFDFFVYNSFIEIVMSSSRQMLVYTEFFNSFLERFNQAPSTVVSIEDNNYRRKRLLINIAKAERIAVSKENFFVFIKEAIELAFGAIFLPKRAFDSEEVLPQIMADAKAFIETDTLSIEIAETLVSLKLSDEIYTMILDYFFEKEDAKAFFLIYIYIRKEEKRNEILIFRSNQNSVDNNIKSLRHGLTEKMINFLLDKGVYDASFLLEYFYKAIYSRQIAMATQILGVIKIFVSQYVYDLCLHNIDKPLDNLLPFEYIDQIEKGEAPINFYLWLFSNDLSKRMAQTITDAERFELLKIEYQVFRKLQKVYEFVDKKFKIEVYYYLACLEINQKTKKSCLYEYLILKKPKKLTMSIKGSVNTYIIVEPDEPKIKKLYYKAISIIVIAYNTHKLRTKELLMEAYALTEISGFDSDIQDYFETVVLALIRNYTNNYITEVFRKKEDSELVDEISYEVMEKYLIPLKLFND